PLLFCLAARDLLFLAAFARPFGACFRFVLAALALVVAAHLVLGGGVQAARRRGAHRIVQRTATRAHVGDPVGRLADRRDRTRMRWGLLGRAVIDRRRAAVAAAGAIREINRSGPAAALVAHLGVRSRG